MVDNNLKVDGINDTQPIYPSGLDKRSERTARQIIEHFNVGPEELYPRTISPFSVDKYEKELIQANRAGRGVLSSNPRKELKNLEHLKKSMDKRTRVHDVYLPALGDPPNCPDDPIHNEVSLALAINQDARFRDPGPVDEVLTVGELQRYQKVLAERVKTTGSNGEGALSYHGSREVSSYDRLREAMADLSYHGDLPKNKSDFESMELKKEAKSLLALVGGSILWDWFDIKCAFIRLKHNLLG